MLVSTFSAAVTTVPATATVVISIIAAFVALPARTFAGAAAFFLLRCRL